MSSEEHRLTKLETLVGVDDPDTGLRGEIREMDRQISTLFRLFRGLEKRIYLAMGGGFVLLWLLNTVATPLLTRLLGLN
jgi:hypothetical protein